MKRTLPLIVLLGTAGLLVPILGAADESPGCSNGKAQWASGSGCCDKACNTAAGTCSARSCCGKTTAKCGTIVDELTAILNETKSAETFLVTTMVLGRLGAESKPALPAIIRNAERLELFEDLYNTQASAENRSLPAQEVIAALEMILDKKIGAKGRIRQSVGPTYNYDAQPTGYRSAPSSSYVPCPTTVPSYTPPSPNSASERDLRIKPVAPTGGHSDS